LASGEHFQFRLPLERHFELTPHVRLGKIQARILLRYDHCGGDSWAIADSGWQGI
jgi:hypothetical protein